MKGDRVEVVVDVGGGVQRFDIRATKAGRRVEIATSRGSVEVTEVTRSGRAVRTARFMATRVVAVVEHPAEDARRALTGLAPGGRDLLTTLGSTGLVVSRIGLGLAALGRPAYITLGRDVDIGNDRARDTMERRCHAMLDAASEAGIRYVDAARSYGRAEEFLASWLAMRHVAPGALTVGSKWGYRYTGAWDMSAAVHETKDHSLAMFRRQLPESIALLGTHLALYQVHSATFESGVLDDHAVLRALAELHDSGIAVGLTVSGPRQADVVRYALDVAVDGVNPFSTVQATWNVLEPSVGPALAEAKARGLGILVKEVLANGLLSGSSASDMAGSAGSPSPLSAVPALTEVVARCEVPLDQVAVAAALDQPWADVILSGAATPSQLDSNIAALGLSLTDEDRSRLASAREEPLEYWDRRSALPWS